MSVATVSTVAVTTFTATASLGALIAAVKAAGAGIATRVPVPVLAGVKIAADSLGVVSVSRFDYEVQTLIEVSGASGSANRSVLVNHKMLLDVLVAAGKRATKRVSDAWQVTISVERLELEPTRVLVNVNGTTFTLSPMDDEQYPVQPSMEAGTWVAVDAAEFIRRMDSAMISASTDDTLPILTGIKIEVKGREMTLLSTDRYRLTLAELFIERPAGEHDYMGEYSVLVRAKTWKAFKRHLSAKGGRIELHFHEAALPGTGGHGYRVSFHQGDVSLGTLAVDGDYPKIRSLFPDTTPIVFEMDADLLLANVQSVAVTAERNTPVRLTYNGIDSLRIDAGTGEDAQAQAFMPYHAERGQRGFAVAFNPHYLIDILKDMKGQVVQIHHTTAPKPAMFEASGQADISHLLMPVRLPGA
jgi:DNA polymerase-3 subunit beta